MQPAFQDAHFLETAQEGHRGHFFPGATLPGQLAVCSRGSKAMVVGRSAGIVCSVGEIYNILYPSLEVTSSP